jgi:hypothetical protein
MIEKSCNIYPACDCASECVEQIAGTASDADAAARTALSEFVTIEQCAESLSIRPNTLRLWIRRDGFPVIKVGGNTKRAKAFVHVPTMREWMLKRQTFGSRFAGERNGSRVVGDRARGRSESDDGIEANGNGEIEANGAGVGASGVRGVSLNLDRMLEDFRTSIEDLRQAFDQREIEEAASEAAIEAEGEAESEVAIKAESEAA